MRNAEKAGFTATKPETTSEEMLNAIRDGLSDLASSNDGEDGEDADDDEEDPSGGKFSKDDEHGWVMGTISNMVPYRMERFRQKQMQRDDSTQPGWGDAAYWFRERDKKYGMTEWKVLAVVRTQMADDAASSVLTIFGEPIETLDSVPEELQMPQETSRPGSSRMRLGSRKPQMHELIPSFPPASVPDWTQIQQSNHLESESFNHCISCPKLITI